MKHYGSENTVLKLSGKALEIYQDTDPLDIYERSTDNGLRYDVEGCAERTDMTEAELIEFLESMAPAVKYTVSEYNKEKKAWSDLDSFNDLEEAKKYRDFLARESYYKHIIYNISKSSEDDKGNITSERIVDGSTLENHFPADYYGFTLIPNAEELIKKLYNHLHLNCDVEVIEEDIINNLLTSNGSRLDDKTWYWYLCETDNAAISEDGEIIDDPAKIEEMFC